MLINDLPNCLHFWQHGLYADDISLTFANTYLRRFDCCLTTIYIGRAYGYQLIYGPSTWRNQVNVHSVEIKVVNYIRNSIFHVKRPSSDAGSICEIAWWAYSPKPWSSYSDIWRHWKLCYFTWNDSPILYFKLALLRSDSGIRNQLGSFTSSHQLLKRTFSYKGVEVWNTLYQDLHSAASLHLNDFKHKLCHHSFEWDPASLKNSLTTRQVLSQSIG